MKLLSKLIVTSLIILIFLLGFVFGKYYEYFFFKPQYIELREKYLLEGLGVLNEGVMLELDKEMPEGFTRCKLYLNLKKGEYDMRKEQKRGLVIPYWLIPVSKQ